MTTKKQNRLEYIDAIKCIAILCIVLLHFEEGIFPKWLNTLIGSFMITAFYVVTGTMHAYKDNNLTIREFVKKRFRQLLIPYFSFSLLIICFDACLYLLNFRGVLDLAKDLCYTLMFRGIGTLWFLPVLFVGEILFLCVKNNKTYLIALVTILVGFLIIKYSVPIQDYSLVIRSNNFNYLALLGEVMSAFSLTIERIIISVLVILVSYNLEKRYSHLFRLNKISSLIYGILFFLLGVVLSLVLSFPYSLDWLRRIIVFISLPYGCLLMMNSIRDWVKIKLVVFFGQNSLIIMLTHYSFILPLCILINGGELHGISSILYFGITVILEIPIIILINRYFKFLIGK